MERRMPASLLDEWRAHMALNAEDEAERQALEATRRKH